MATGNKRKICFVITSFIHYSRSFLILDELKKRSDVDLHIIVGGTALLSKYSSKSAHVKEILEKDGFKNIYELYFNLEGDSHIVKAKTTGLGIIEFATLFENIKPDLVVVRGDRFEVFSATLAASYSHIPIAHIEGGDLSGTIDESVRHAITKLSHIHFTTNDDSKRRVIKMGEDKKSVFNFGSPEVEIVQKIGVSKKLPDISKTGSGYSVDLKKDFLMVMFHPVTSELDSLRNQTRDLLDVVHNTGKQVLWFWPNFDAGAEDISHELRVFKDEVSDHKIRFMRYLPPRDFIALLGKTLCLVGNSSAGIKEASFLGVPVVDIGNRQSGRLCGENVYTVAMEKNKIKKAFDKQMSVGRYKGSDIYKGKDTAQNISKTLATTPLYIQKKFND